jgi:dGTPase
VRVKPLDRKSIVTSSSSSLIQRSDRFYRDKAADNRLSFQRDRDRILYTTSFRRLARVTQVVSSDEGHVFHNRLTHSLQVAQVGRRISEKLCRDYDKMSRSSSVDIDPDVVESACLAHDIGHPPFGHIAEKELDAIAKSNGLEDGFEGNAQSFRIVTRLAMGSTDNGLNLTRATLNAILKYPWLHGQNPKKLDKWGAYESDKELFDWARELGTPTFVQSNEARLMDWSDDVTYSVHDVDDFYRAGVIPLDRLVVDAEERERFYKEVFDRRKDTLPKDMDQTYLRGAFDALMSPLNVRKPYTPTREDRIRLRRVSSTLIRDFVTAVQLLPSGSRFAIDIEKRRRAEIFMLKQLTWHYVIKNPALATQQHGQRMIIRQLFDAFYQAGTNKSPNIDFFPISVRELLPVLPAKKPKATRQLARAILDFIASLTEEQAIATHHRIHGIKLGSSLVFQVR